jgi:hypothetical protein
VRSEVRRLMPSVDNSRIETGRHRSIVFAHPIERAAGRFRIGPAA